MQDGTDNQEIEVLDAFQDLGRARGLVYAFLARQVLEPPPVDIEGLERLRIAWSELGPLVDDALRPELERVLSVEPLRVEVLRRDFDALLSIQGPGNLFPTESSQLGGTENETGQWVPGRGRALAWHRVIEAYARNGWSFDTERGVEADHIGAELLFLARLCELEVDAWSRGDTVRAASVWNEQLAFIDRHPLAWIERLQARAAVTGSRGYYPLVIDLAASYLKMERHHLRRVGRHHDREIASC